MKEDKYIQFINLYRKLYTSSVIAKPFAKILY